MNDFKFLKLWLVIGWLLVFLVVFFSLCPKPPRLTPFQQGDKLEHLAAYLVLMLWFSNIYREKNRRVSMAAAFFAMGAVLELLQGLSGEREFGYTDMAANGLGICLGWFLAKTWFGTLLARLDTLVRQGP